MSFRDGSTLFQDHTHPDPPAIQTVSQDLTTLLARVAALETLTTNLAIETDELQSHHPSSSTTLPDVGDIVEGSLFYESDVDKLWCHNGAAWVEMGRTGAWTDYTPALTQGAAVTKTVTYARWARFGRTIVANGLLTCTASGTASTVIEIGLPVVAVLPASDRQAVGIGYIRTTVFITGTAVLRNNSAMAFLPHSTDSGNFLGAAVFTAALASGNQISWQIVYEAAAST